MINKYYINIIIPMAEYKCQYCQKKWKYKKAFTEHTNKCIMKGVIEGLEPESDAKEPEPEPERTG